MKTRKEASSSLLQYKHLQESQPLCNIEKKMAASSSTVFLYTTLVLLTSTQTFASGCYKSIISFGDSLADTGNLLSLFPSNHPPHFALPPYGKSFFGHPTGRCSDGRLVIDFIAESLRLPLVLPYFESANVKRRDFGEGVNYAVAGATALDNSFFLEKGVHNPFTNVSLGTQMDWFKEMLASLCKKSSDCKEFLQSSLILMGEIGGNDYNHPLLQGISIEEVQTFVPSVARTIASAINELIELGAKTLVVPGNFPIGCSAAYLTAFQSSNKKDYNPSGCLKWLNKFAKYHNQMLQNELNRLREIHPHATIIYADYYNAAAPIYRSPNKFGFKWALSACCGGGGLYNYNESAACGYHPATCCEDPSLYVCWDGLHLTEAAYRWIARGLLRGPYANPPLTTICASLPSGNRELVYQI